MTFDISNSFQGVAS